MVLFSSVNMPAEAEFRVLSPVNLRMNLYESRMFPILSYCELKNLLVSDLMDSFIMIFSSDILLAICLRMA